MPVYNAEDFLSETINSVLVQTYNNFDFLIINDGSKDKSENIILSYNDPRIIYLKNKENMGIIPTLNRGLDHINSKYIIRMDADDIAMPHRISAQVDYMDKNPDVVLSGSGKVLYIEGKEYKEKVLKVIEDDKILLFKSIFNTSIPHPSAILRNEIIQTNNIRYDESYYGAEDKAMWLDMAKYGKLGNLVEPLIKYRAHENQMSNVKIKESRRNSVRKTIQVLKDYGINLNSQEEEALEFICYPYNCRDRQTLLRIQKLIDKLSREFKNMDFCNASFIDQFFKDRIKRILIWSTPIGLSLIGFIIRNNQLKMREFGFNFYKKALKKAEK